MSYFTKIIHGSIIYLKNGSVKPIDEVDIGDELVSYIPSDLKISHQDIELIKDKNDKISHSTDDFPAKGKFVSNKVKSIDIIRENVEFIKINENINNSNTEDITRLEKQTKIYTNRGWVSIIDENPLKISDCYLNWKNRWKVIYEITNSAEIDDSIFNVENSIWKIETENDNIVLESFIIKQ